MKTIANITYLAFVSLVAVLTPISVRGQINVPSQDSLSVGINGTGMNGGGFIYHYTPTAVQSLFAAGLSRPRGVAFDHAGNLFVANTTVDARTGTSQGSIVKITLIGTQSTFASLVGNIFLLDLAVDQANDTFVIAQDNTSATGASTIYKFTPGGVQSTFGSVPGQGFGLAFDSVGNLFAADSFDQIIYKFTPNGTRTVFAGPSAFGPDSGPVGLAFDSFENLFVSTESNSLEPDTIRKFTPDGTESTFATGLNNPRGLAFDRSGNLFVAEIIQDAPGDILKFTPNGTMTIFASGIGPGGNGGPEYLAFEFLPLRVH